MFLRKHTQPTRLERLFVLAAQCGYAAAYATLYVFSPTTAHRSVGFLEECAHRAYNDYLRAIDAGQIVNVPAGEIARQYYRLPEEARLRDVVLHVRGDEAYHAIYNHHLADLLKRGHGQHDPVPPEADEKKD
jgi:ubiquinol oxidase